MALFQRMIHSSKFAFSSSINSYSYFSSISSGHGSSYRRISTLVNRPDGLINPYSFFPSNSCGNGSSYRRISQFIKPDGKGGYHLDKFALARRLRVEEIPEKHVEKITSILGETLQTNLEFEKHKVQTTSQDSKGKLVEQNSEVSDYSSTVSNYGCDFYT